MSRGRGVGVQWEPLSRIENYTYSLVHLEYKRASSMAISKTAAVSIGDKVVPLFDLKDQKESEKKWGKAVMSHGYCIFPSILLQAQGRLGVSAQEMVVLLQLAEHWWKFANKVYPSKDVIAQRVGLSTKQCNVILDNWRNSSWCKELSATGLAGAVRRMSTIFLVWLQSSRQLSLISLR